MLTKIVGITGNSGSGKSQISKFMSELGVITIDLDEVAKDAVDSDIDCLNKLRVYFGDDIFDNNGLLIRGNLARKAFKTKQNTEKLNDITHKVMIKRLKYIIDEYKKKNIDIIVIDAAILFESGIYKECDIIITAVCPYDISIERIMLRDSIDLELAKMRLNAQTGKEKYINKSDYIIDTNIPIDELRIKIYNIVDAIRRI